MSPALIAALLLAAPENAGVPTVTADTRPIPFPTEEHALRNGLRVVFVPYDAKGLVAYYTLMRVGSRNEVEPGRSGYAHFFEHMMFRGTRQHPADDYNNTVTRLGLNTNAFTSDDMTVYHLYGPAQALPTIIEYEADRFAHLDYGEPAFRTEAGAIMGEYQKSASIPEQKLDEAMRETAYSRHTYAHTTIGYLRDIAAMPEGFDYSREFFRRYYTPDNATVFVVGEFDAKATLALIEQKYGPWRGKLDAAPVPAEPKQTGAREAHLTWPTPTLPRLWLAWHAPGAADLKAAAAQNLLSAYLFGPTSPLYQSLVLGNATVDSIDPTYGDQRDPALFGVLLRVKDARNLRATEKAVLDDVAALAQGKVDAARMEAVRANLTYAMPMQLDTADRVAQALAVTTALTGEVDWLNRMYAELHRLTPADLAAFAGAHLVDQNRTTVTLVSKDGAQ